MKKDYLKPMLEVVEIQLSDCIAGSGPTVVSGYASHTELGRGSDWSLDGVESLEASK